MSREASVTLVRNYRKSASTCESCAQAVRLLLNFGESKQKGRSPSGPYDGTKSKEDSANAPIIQK